MAVTNQEAKTRHLANTNAPEIKKQCGKCPFAKEYSLVERPLVLVDREGRAHSLNGYVREGGNWLDGMVSILKQNGAVAEKIYLPGCGWGISAAVLKDGTVIQNPHGYFDGMLPVAVMGGGKTELNFANIRIDDQRVVIKDESPKCPAGNSLVDTEGLVFGKGEYGELNPNSGMISWGSINPIGVPMRQFLERAPTYLLPQIGQGLAVLPNPMGSFQQNLLVGVQGYDAVAFRKMGIREDYSYSGQGAVGFTAAAVAAPLVQESVAQPMAQIENLPVQEIRVERIRITEAGKEPEGREEIKCAEGKPADAGMRRSVPELPSQEARVEFSFEEKAVWKADAPKEERKPEERKEEAGKGTGKKAEPSERANVKKADIPADSPAFIRHDAKAQKAERKVNFTNWKVWIPGMPQRMKRKKAKKDGLHTEFGKDKTAPGKVRNSRNRAISEKIKLGDAKEMPGPGKEKKQKFLATEMKVAKAKRAKEKREKKVTEELRARKTGRGKKVNEKRAGMAAERRKRGDYAEKCLLMEKPKKQKRRNWLSISRR